MRHILLPTLLLACGAHGAEPELRSQAPADFWAHWGDGKAELNRYALTQPRYGELREGSAVLVFVTEDTDRTSRVKTDRPDADKFPVIKLNEVRDFPTGIYDYNTMLSGFVPLDGSAPLGIPTKTSLTVQEWCGHIYEQWVMDPGTARVERHSYFDGEGDERLKVHVPAGAVYADVWPILVRGLAGELLAPGATLERPWLPTLLHARFAHEPAAFTTASITRSADTAEIEVPAGRFATWTATVTLPNGYASTWWVEAAAPHRLIRWEASDGEVGELSHSIREPYWAMHGNKHAGDRSRLGL